MKKNILLLTLMATLLVILPATAQNPVDSALIVTEIATDDDDLDNDTTQTGTWTFGTSGQIDASDDDADMEEMEEWFEKLFDEEDGFFRPFFKIAEKASNHLWVFALIPILIFFVLPLLILFLILYFVYKGRKAKYNTYQKMAASGQPIPEETLKEMSEEDMKMRNEGLRDICLGVGLAIFLGIILDEIGVGIGALIACIGLGKLLSWNATQKDKRRDPK